MPIVTGPAQGVAGVPVTFKATATDPEGDSIALEFDWGDNTALAWHAFLASGETLTASHTFADSGTFTIKVNAKDKNGKESGWSDGRDIGLVESGPARPESLVCDLDVQYQSNVIMATPNGAFAIIGHIQRGSLVRVVETGSQTVYPTQTLVGGPTRMAMGPDGSFAVVACTDENAIVLMRPPWDSIESTLMLHDSPNGLGVEPDGLHLVVVQTESHSLLVADLPTLAVVDSVQLDDLPVDLALSPTGGLAYVALAHGIAVVDLASRNQTGTVVPEFEPGIIRATPDGSTLLASSRADSGFCCINLTTGQITRSVNVHDIAIGDVQSTPDGIYHVVSDLQGVKFVSASTGVIVDSLVTAARPRIAFDASGDRMFLAGGGHFYVYERPQ
jgi:DNA-binding beta-propeller fold protein YncE